VLVYQNRREVEVLRRSSSDGAWTKTVISGEQALSLDSLGVALPLSEVYEAVDVS
jgi:hypothetical protein